MNHKEKINEYRLEFHSIVCKVINDIKSIIKELDSENHCIDVSDVYGLERIVYIGESYVIKKIYYNNVGNIFIIVEDDNEEKRFHIDYYTDLSSLITIYSVLINYKDYTENKFA